MLSHLSTVLYTDYSVTQEVNPTSQTRFWRFFLPLGRPLPLVVMQHYNAHGVLGGGEGMTPNFSPKFKPPLSLSFS